MTAPWLVLAWGNDCRGDDALGPAALAGLQRAWAGRGDIDYLLEHQLQVEHALDLLNRRGVLFIDASVAAPAPFALQRVRPQADPTLGSHALSPAALLQVLAEVVLPVARPPLDVAPPAWLLAIRGERFGLGEPLSAAAQDHLQTALHLLGRPGAAPPANDPHPPWAAGLA